MNKNEILFIDDEKIPDIAYKGDFTILSHIYQVGSYAFATIIGVTSYN